MEGLNRLEDALVGLLGLLDRGANSAGGGLLAPLLPASSASDTAAATTTEQGQEQEQQQLTAALLLAERLGAPRALRDVTAAWHRGEVGFGAAAQQVLAALDEDEVRFFCVRSVRW